MEWILNCAPWRIGKEAVYGLICRRLIYWRSPSDTEKKNNLATCFSIYFSSRNPKRATELSEEIQPVDSKSNIKLDMKLNATICLSFKNITRKIPTANLRLVANLIVSRDTSTVYGELCWLIWLQNQEASGLKQRLTVCVLSATEWLV